MKLIQTQNLVHSMRWMSGATAIAAAAALFVGCQSDKCCAKKTEVASAPVAPIAAIAPVIAAPPAPITAPMAIRIKAGNSTATVDSSGNAWLPDQGFEGGDTIDRGNDLAIANTKDAALYRTERYGMNSFKQKLPNGKYTVKLHFAETFDGITAAGERVFSFNVEGKEFKDFDVFAKAGGGNKAYVETVNVEVVDGKLDISFTSNVENPEINGIEIIPAS